MDTLSLDINAVIARAMLFESLAARFGVRAGTAYARHEDARATWYRDLADEMRRDAQGERTKQRQYEARQGG